jgi:hypothetical protein
LAGRGAIGISIGRRPVTAPSPSPGRTPPGWWHGWLPATARRWTSWSGAQVSAELLMHACGDVLAVRLLR